jgi:hypothetical protein
MKYNRNPLFRSNIHGVLRMMQGAWYSVSQSEIIEVETDGTAVSLVGSEIASNRPLQVRFSSGRSAWSQTLKTNVFLFSYVIL